MNYEDNIQIARPRTGMTCSYDFDEATGEFLGFEVKENIPFAEEEADLIDYQEAIEQDAFSPDDQDPDFEVRLAETFEEVNNTSYDINPTLAYEIASADIGSSRSDAAVQLFASQVFNGDLTPEEAFTAAVETGLNPDELMRSYYKLKEAFQ